MLIGKTFIKKLHLDNKQLKKILSIQKICLYLKIVVQKMKGKRLMLCELKRGEGGFKFYFVSKEA